MGFLDRWLGPRADEPEPERESVLEIDDPDIRQIYEWIDQGFKVNFFSYPEDRWGDKKFSIMVRPSDKLELGSQFHPTLRGAIDEVSENLVKLGLTKPKDPDIVPSVAPRGSDTEDLDN